MGAMRRAGVGAVLVAGVLVAGCSSTGGSSQSSTGGLEARAPAVAPGAPNAGSNAVPNAKLAAPGGGAAAGAGQAGSGGQAAPLPPGALAGRQVVRTASITLTVGDVPGAAARAKGYADAAGGYPANEDATDDHATLVLEVPVDRVDAVLGELAGLGHPTNQGAQAQDVTDQIVDVRARIAAQQASVDRVRALLDRATSIADIVSIEGELNRREADLESLEQRNAEVAGQVAMSAITVGLNRTAPAPPPPPPARATGFAAGLAAGWHAFLGAVGVALVVLGAVLPFALVLGIPATAWWWLRRRRRPAPAAAGPAAAPDGG